MLFRSCQMTKPAYSGLSEVFNIKMLSARIAKTLICITLLCKISATKILFVAMAAGGQNVQLGYEVIGSAYDVAIEKARRLYPRVYEDVYLSRYFTPGRFSCEEAVGITTAGLGLLYINDKGERMTASKTKDQTYFRIVLTPGCTFEMFTLADFSREEGVSVFGSTASINMRQLQRRFPTFFPWSANPYGNAATAVFTLMRYYRWNKFNLVCDTSTNTPFTYVFEVSCNLFQQISSNFRDVNMVTLKFDSSKNSTIAPMLRSCRLTSAITVMASVPKVYKEVLTKAASVGMTNGDYVFLLFPVTTFTQIEDFSWGPADVNAELASILPFTFALSFDAVDWKPVTDEVNEMTSRSLTFYNWTIKQEFQRNFPPLAAYETVMILSQVLNETYDQLDNVTARQFARAFLNRTFILPTRTVRISQFGHRIADVWIRQFHTNTSRFETALRYDSENSRIVSCEDCADISWHNGVFPPPNVPACGLDGELCQNSGSSIAMKTVITALLTLFCGLVAGTAQACRVSRRQTDLWWILDSSLQPAKPPRRMTGLSLQLKQVLHENFNAAW